VGSVVTGAFVGLGLGDVLGIGLGEGLGIKEGLDEGS